MDRLNAAAASGEAPRVELCPQMVQPPEVRLVRFGIDPTSAGQPRLVLGRQLDSDLLGDRPRDVALQRQHVRQLAIVALVPQVRIAARVNELNRDAYSVLRAHDGALDHCIHVELLSDLA